MYCFITFTLEIFNLVLVSKLNSNFEEIYLLPNILRQESWFFQRITDTLELGTGAIITLQPLHSFNPKLSAVQDFICWDSIYALAKNSSSLYLSYQVGTYSVRISYEFHYHEKTQRATHNIRNFKLVNNLRSRWYINLVDLCRYLWKLTVVKRWPLVFLCICLSYCIRTNLDAKPLVPILNTKK